MPLRAKLALSFLSVGLIPVLVMAIVVYLQASRALEEQSLNALEAVASIKQRQLMDAWKARNDQLSQVN